MDKDREIAWWRGIAWVITAYFAAFITGIVAGRVSGYTDPLAVAAVADVAATVAIFVFSFRFGNTSFYDAYWSVAPMAIVGYWLVWPGVGGDDLRQGLVVGATVFWGVRLTANWATGWTGLRHEDWRYVQLRQQTGPLYWLVSLFGLHLFPTVVVFAGLWSAWVALSSPVQANLLDAVAALLAIAAVLIEGTADRQLAAWRATAPEPGAVMNTGLWRYSRHPNYLGELLFWVSMWLFAVAADPAQIGTVVGPLAMGLMFRFVSIPMMENRQLERRPAYAAYQASTSMLVLWPPTRGHSSGAVTPEAAPAPSEPTADDPGPSTPAAPTAEEAADHEVTGGEPVPGERADEPDQA